jgi:murein DD-endopeptidase MepM/ murein hydrolase activator NlpD
MARIKIIKTPKRLPKAAGGMGIPPICPDGQTYNQNTGECEDVTEDVTSTNNTFNASKTLNTSPVNPNATNTTVPFDATKFNAFTDNRDWSASLWNQNAPLPDQANANRNITPPYNADYKGPIDPAAKNAFNSFAETPKSKKTFNSKDAAQYVGKNINSIGTTLSAGFNMWDQNKKQKDFNKWQKQSLLPDNIYAVNTNEDRGDYDVNNGIFQPNKLGYKSKGTQANQYQAQQNFSRYGGSLPYAAEGMAVQGDTNVRAALLPESSAYIPTMPRTTSASVPRATAPEEINSTTSDNTNASYVLPVQNFKISSGYGGRKAPKAGASTFHNGLDLAVPLNSNVFSPMDGVVKSIYTDGHGGNQLIIQHADGSSSGYAHLNSYKIKVGDHVNKGQVIALSGNTGNSTGPHLHFTWHGADGNTIDPRNIFNFDLGTKTGNTVGGGGKQTSFSHNNPMNIHYGDFAAKYGAKSGSNDAGGKVAIFPTLEIGIQANKDLLFGSGYNNLTISQARNRWVSGDPNVTNASTASIVKAMGGNKRLSELTPAEKNKLFKEFTKWEGSQGYDLIKNRQIFENGGQNNNNMKIRITGTPNHMSYGGMYATGGEPCTAGPHMVRNEEGNCICEEGYTADQMTGICEANTAAGAGTTGSNPIVMPPINTESAQQGQQGTISGGTPGSGQGFHGGINLKGGFPIKEGDPIKRGAYDFNYALDTAPDMKSNLVHHAGISFPGLFNAGKTKGGLGISGMYAPNKSWSGNLNAGIPLNYNGASKLSISGGLGQNFASMSGSPNAPMMSQGMMTDPTNSNRYWNASIGYKGQLGKGKSAPKLSIDASYHKAYGGEFAQGGQSPYSGQSDYGLYIGQRNLYKTMAKHPYEDASKSVTQDDNSKSPYVLEAEGGETILRPDGTHMNITGRRHSEGGEKLNKEQAPEGSFIFSDTKKMRIKDPAVLKHFGKTSGNPTPAEIAKQYDVNKYMGILQDPNTDVLSKNTARRMIDTYQKKLAELSLVQEQMKGFPQGIPEVAKSVVSAAAGPMQGMAPSNSQGPDQQQAKYGGALHKFVNGSEVTDQYPVPKWFRPWVKSKTKAGSLSPTGKQTTFDAANPNKFYVDYNNWKAIAQKEGVLTAGNDFNSPEEFQNFIYDYVSKKDPKAIEDMWTNWGTTNRGKKFPKDPRKAFADKFFGARTATLTDWTETPPPPPPVIEDGDGYDGGDYEDYGDDGDVETTIETTSKQDMDLVVPGGDPNQNTLQRKWTSQNKRDLVNAGLDYASLKKYHPRTSTIQPVLPEFIPQDWKGYAASLQSGQNAAANQMGTYQPGQGMASNLSFLQGQTAGDLGKYITGVDQYNATGATNMDLQRANILNQYTQANAAARDKDWMDENTLDDRYRAAERLARKGVVKATDLGEDVASKLYNQNLTEKYFDIDPRTQTLRFKSDAAKAAWEAETSGTPTQGSGANAVARYKEIYDGLSYLPEPQRSATATSILNGTGGKMITKEQEGKPDIVTTTETTSKYGGRVPKYRG